MSKEKEEIIQQEEPVTEVKSSTTENVETEEKEPTKEEQIKAKILEDDDIVKEVNEKWNLPEHAFTKRMAGNNIPIYFGLFFTDIPVDEITKYMEEKKYFVGKSEEVQFGEITLIKIQYEGMENKDKTQYVHDAWKKLYHWTPNCFVDSILKEGLKPMNNNERFKFPPRVYLLADILDEYSLTHGWIFCDANNIEKNDGNYTCFEINVEDLPMDIKIYDDPMSTWSVYTESPIPPEYLKIKWQMNLKEHTVPEILEDYKAKKDAEKEEQRKAEEAKKASEENNNS